MSKIGTHDSATGEPARNLLSKLLTPFCCTQNLSLEAQWVAGSRFFDLRIRPRDGRYVLCHGLWESKTYFRDAITTLSRLGKLDGEKPTYVIVTLEDEYSEEEARFFANKISRMLRLYNGVRLAYIAVKKPEWTVLYSSKDCPMTYKGFRDLSTMPYKLLPCPWFWNLFYHREADSDMAYNLVDFLK